MFIQVGIALSGGSKFVLLDEVLAYRIKKIKIKIKFIFSPHQAWMYLLDDLFGKFF